MTSEIQASDYCLRLRCAHATEPTRRAYVSLREQVGQHSRRRDCQVMAIPTLDTWIPDTLRQAIRELHALLPAHDAAASTAIVTLREWKTGSQKIVITVTAGAWTGTLTMTSSEHGGELTDYAWRGASEPMLVFLRSISGKALTVGAFNVPALNRTVAQLEAVAAEEAPRAEAQVALVRRIARLDPEVQTTIANIVQSFLDLEDEGDEDDE